MRLTEWSETATLASNILRGIEQHGRRYQALREGAYFAPSDEQQFEAQDSGYIVQLLLDQNAPNVFFFSPISKTTGHVLDIGCGRGTWCLDVAEQFPNLMVHGVDLSPPPQVWMPPNCSFSVDDICEEWTWSNKWNLIYLRNLAGCFTDQQWTDLYAQAYE